MAEELKIGVLEQMNDISFTACIKVIHTQHIVTLLQEAITEVGSEEPGATGDKDAFSIMKHVGTLVMIAETVDLVGLVGLVYLVCLVFFGLERRYFINPEIILEIFPPARK